MTRKKDFDRRVFNGPKTWSDAAVADLRKWWPEGRSASEIVAKLKQVHGKTVTRNAVLGKLDRLGILKVARHTASAPTMAVSAPVSEPASQILHMPPVKRAKITLAGHVVKMSPDGSAGNDLVVAPLEGAAGVAMADLPDNGCRMIVSAPDQSEPLYCGCRCARSKRGRFESFCEAHKMLAYVPGSARRPSPPPVPRYGYHPSAQRAARQALFGAWG